MIKDPTYEDIIIHGRILDWGLYISKGGSYSGAPKCIGRNAIVDYVKNNMNVYKEAKIWVKKPHSDNGYIFETVDIKDLSNEFIEGLVLIDRPRDGDSVIELIVGPDTVFSYGGVINMNVKKAISPDPSEKMRITKKRLLAQLDEALKKENFELAAQLRDKISKKKK